MLTIVEAPELIARDDDDYVRIAVELCGDAPRRAQLRSRLLDNAKRLFESRDGQRGLQEFLIAETATAAAAHAAADTSPPLG
jgi:predicted O-linked N-acetylglucosamine transferase (SPINDLY family)